MLCLFLCGGKGSAKFVEKANLGRENLLVEEVSTDPARKFGHFAGTDEKRLVLNGLL